MKVRSGRLLDYFKYRGFALSLCLVLVLVYFWVLCIVVLVMDLSRIQAANVDGRTQNTRYRQSQFQRLQSALVDNIAEIQDAIRADSGHSQQEIRAEVVLGLQELRSHYATLDLSKDLEVEYRVAHGKDNFGGARGAGIVYIIPCVHTLFFSVISALTAALAAGNCIVLEVSLIYALEEEMGANKIQLPQTTMALPVLLRKVLTDALDHDTFAITAQRPDSSFLSKALVVVQNDTGGLHGLISPAASRTVAVVDRTAKVAEAAQALVAARFALGGRSPYSPDVVLVNEFVMKPFVEAVIQQASKYLAGENGEARQTTGPSRRSALLDAVHKDRNARALVSGSNWGVIEVQDRNSPLLQRKIDEKVLLVHPVTSLDDAIDFNA